MSATREYLRQWEQQRQSLAAAAIDHQLASSGSKSDHAHSRSNSALSNSRGKAGAGNAATAHTGAGPSTTTAATSSKAMLNGFLRRNPSRRSELFKAVRPWRSPAGGISRVATKNRVWAGQQQFNRGDIVSVRDSSQEATAQSQNPPQSNGRRYYAQISAFTCNSYAQCFAHVVWLLPKRPLGPATPAAAATNEFHPHDYAHGLVERRPVPVECLRFVRSAPVMGRYMREWGDARQLAMEQARRELARRVRELRDGEGEL